MPSRQIPVWQRKECELPVVGNPPLVGELYESGGVLYEKFSPASGETIFDWYLPCSEIPLTVVGSFGMQIAAAKTTQLERVFEAPAGFEAPGALLRWGGFKVKFAATWTNALAGSRSGKKWAAE